MADLEKKIVIPVEPELKNADAKIDKFKKNAEDKGVQIPVNVDLTDITKALKGIETFLLQINKAFDKNVKFSGMQKGLDDVLEKLNKVTRIVNKGNPKEIQMFRVDVRGFDQLYKMTEAMQKNIESLNDSKIDVSSFDKLEDVLKNIENVMRNIRDGLNFETIRPSVMVQSDIEKTTKQL